MKGLSVGRDREREVAFVEPTVLMGQAENCNALSTSHVTSLHVLPILYSFFLICSSCSSAASASSCSSIIVARSNEADVTIWRAKGMSVEKSRRGHFGLLREVSSRKKGKKKIRKKNRKWTKSVWRFCFQAAPIGSLSYTSIHV